MESIVTAENNKVCIHINEPCNTAQIYVNGILVYEVERKRIKFIDIELIERE